MSENETPETPPEKTAKGVELILTKLFAAAFSLTVDKTIFRGFLPEDKLNALGVIIEGFTNGNYPANGCHEFSFQLLGRYTRRQDAMEMCNTIDHWLPRYSVRLRLTKIGSGAVYETSAKGKRIWELSINGKAVFTKIDDNPKTTT